MAAVIYLDVDGVLNRLGPAGASGPDEFTDFVLHRDVAGYDLQLSEDMVARLAALPAEIRWLTTWRHRAPAAVAPLVGAPDWPWLAYDREKVDAVVEDQLAAPRPWVWIDDVDAVPWHAERVDQELQDHGYEAPPRELVCPDPFLGLTRSQLQRVAAFCHRHAR